MSDLTTIARPYAKALFEYALDAGQLPLWSDIIHRLAQVVLNPAAEYFINNPSSSAEQQSQLFMAVMPASEYNAQRQNIDNLVSLLAENKRLIILPDIYAQYEILRAEQEKTLAVDVTSYSELTKTQQQQLISSLGQRLQRQIHLNVAIDKSLLGGAVIKAGDLVIDGSVRGKLNKLRTGLAA